MIRQNLHTHTLFDDGKNTPLEMAQAALDAGLSSLGFSGHSVLPFPNDWSLTEDRVPVYLAAVEEAKEAFRGRLEICSGIEWDGLSRQSIDGFDYVIGSLHHIAAGGEALSIDESPEETRRILQQYYHGNEDAMSAAYFAQYAGLAENPAIDIVGHFDVLTKFSEKEPLFRGSTPSYRDCAMAAMELLVRADKIFEVNTGAIAAGWRATPYPSVRLLRELKARNARVLISSDAHRASAIGYGFEDAEALLRELRFREIWHFSHGGFVPYPWTDSAGNSARAGRGTSSRPRGAG